MMESIHHTLRLYIPPSERSCVSPPFSCCRSTSAPFSTSLKPPWELPTEEEEEDATESEKPSFHLADFSEILQVLDDFCEIRQLAEVLRLHVHCQAVVDMRNQQGVKVKPCCRGFGFNHDSFPKSRYEVLKNSRAKGEVYTSSRITVRLPPEVAKADGDTSMETEEITLQPNHRRSSKGPRTPSHDFTFAKSISPVLAPLLKSGPCPLSLTEQLEEFTSEGHNPSTNPHRDRSSVQHTGHPERIPTVMEHGGENASQQNLELIEQDLTCTSEISPLLASGKNVKLPLIYLCHYL